MEEFDLQSLLSSNEKTIIHLLQSYAQTNGIAVFVLGNDDHLQAGIFGELSEGSALTRMNKMTDLSKLSVNKYKYNIEYADSPLRIASINQRVGKICVAQDIEKGTNLEHLQIMQQLQKHVLFLRNMAESVAKLIIKNRGIDSFVIKYAIDVNDAIDELADSEGHALQQIKVMSTANSSIISAIEYIDSNLNKRLTLDQVSSKVYLSDYYFSKLFKRETGLSFSVYLNARKIQKAMILLKESDKSVNDISDALGFTRLSYFSQTFKKYTGVAPTKYRTEGK
ncbi:helix-turn-helix transcriptional regulator [Companilactobacillus nantensis]|uniref:Two component transcriptional regulator, arac family protein n=1 Tax=Companilactobacillus nantensis DSM 16982 TaxID=1423774 RepID=A0A0R1WAE0_9LACO|nr:AraC family transcriptional regulator [Companilactobacillus nantensis]KRM14485.1 two component transcriptional regulator, arac family protein [Companilactobacillus nantensis DSM 16982]